jgi:hypothetical protein
MLLDNDSGEGQGTIVTAEYLHARAKGVLTDADVARDIAYVKQMARTPAPSIPSFTVNRKGVGTVAQTAPLSVTPAAYRLYSAGKGMFYFAGSLIYTIDGRQWIQPICGYSSRLRDGVLQC